MSTPRPAGIDAGAHTHDDGLFGPDSVTWRVMAHPATGLGAAAAAMVQMLYPPVMYVVDQSSHVRQDPQRRAQRTGDYATTITYGDTDAAEAAGAALRRLHNSRMAVDPDSGRKIVADEPDLLNWVHNALTWSLLRAHASYGLALTPAERDTFVAEQRISARLVGCNPDDVAADATALEAYMASMDARLALTSPGLWFRDLLIPPGRPTTPAAGIGKLLSGAVVGLLGPIHRRLYGFPRNRLADLATTIATRGPIQAAAAKLPLDLAIPQLREHVDTHAFGSRRKVVALGDARVP
jgi:uncharacterized protein (DUF2236 family)